MSFKIEVASFASVGLSGHALEYGHINVMLNLLPRSMTVLFANNLACSCDFAGHDESWRDARRRRGGADHSARD